MALALLYVGMRVKVIALGYEVSKLKTEGEEMKRGNSLLSSEIAEKRSTAKLANWAKQLGLGPPASDQILFIKE